MLNDPSTPCWKLWHFWFINALFLYGTWTYSKEPAGDSIALAIITLCSLLIGALCYFSGRYDGALAERSHTKGL